MQHLNTKTSVFICVGHFFFLLMLLLKTLRSLVSVHVFLSFWFLTCLPLRLSELRASYLIQRIIHWVQREKVVFLVSPWLNYSPQSSVPWLAGLLKKKITLRHMGKPSQTTRTLSADIRAQREYRECTEIMAH